MVVVVAGNAAVIVMNASLRGKRRYYLSHSRTIWMFVQLSCGPFFVTIATVLCQGLVCTDDPTLGLVLVQDPSTVCWQGSHLFMAIGSLVCLGVFITQATLLPAGTFKETMISPDHDDILFVGTWICDT